MKFVLLFVSCLLAGGALCAQSPDTKTKAEKIQELEQKRSNLVKRAKYAEQEAGRLESSDFSNSRSKLAEAAYYKRQIKEVDAEILEVRKGNK